MREWRRGVGVTRASDHSNSTDRTLAARERGSLMGTCLEQLNGMIYCYLHHGMQDGGRSGSKKMNVILDMSSCGHLGKTWT